MKKTLLLALLGSFLSFQAFADDGGIVVLDVQGIIPGVASTPVEVYGGALKAFYDVLPESAVPDVHGKSLAIASKGYAISLDCTRDYDRAGKPRKDYSCSWQIANREKGKGIDDPEENILPINDFSHFSPYAYNTDTLHVVGVNPNKTPEGPLFSFYGGRTALFATSIPPELVMYSGKYVFTIACKPDYVRPTDGAYMNDYMCTVHNALR